MTPISHVKKLRRSWLVAEPAPQRSQTQEMRKEVVKIWAGTPFPTASSEVANRAAAHSQKRPATSDVLFLGSLGASSRQICLRQVETDTNDRDKGRGKEGRDALKIITYIKFVLLGRFSGIKFVLKYVNAKVIKMPFTPISVQRGEGTAARRSRFWKITENDSVRLTKPRIIEC